MSELFESNEAAWKLIARGKVRDIYEFGRNEMLIVTTDRLSAFDVVLPTPIPGKGQVLTRSRTSGSEDRRPHAQPPARPPTRFARTAPCRPGGTLRGGAQDRAAARSRPSCAAIWPAPAGRSIRGSGTVCGIAAAGRPAESDRLPEPIFTPVHQGRGRRARREHPVRADGGADWAPSSPPRSRDASAGPLHGRRRLRPRRAASSSPTPSSSSAFARRRSDPRSTRCSRPIRRASGRLDSYAPGSRSPASTSSSCATTSRPSTGTRSRPARRCPPMSPRRRPRSTARRGAA